MLKKTIITGLTILAIIAAFPAWAGGKQDVKGMEVIIGNWWMDYDVNTFKPQNEAAERMLNQRKKLMQENGIIIREKMLTDWNGMQQQAVISTMSGKPTAQVFLLQPNWAMAMRARGLLAPLPATIKTPTPIARGYSPVEFSQSTINSFTFDGKPYAFSVGVNLNNFQVVFFNKRLFREAGLDPNLPYDMQKAGTWTWAAFLDICKKLTRDINNDGIKDTYAMTRDLSTDMLDAIISSNGGRYVDKDPKTGKFVNASGRPEFLEGLQFAIRLQTEGVLKPKPETANWDWYKPEFADGKVAMRVDESYVMNELQNMRDDWGMVLFPKGPRSTNYRVFTRENIMVIPATYNLDTVEKILVATSLWFTPVNDDWKSGLYNTFRDRRAVDETIALIRDTKLHMVKYFTYINGLNRGGIAWEMWYHDGDPAQLIESVSQTWNAIIEDSNF